MVEFTHMAANATPIPIDFYFELIQASMDAHIGKRRAIPPLAERCLEDAPEGSYVISDSGAAQGISTVLELCRQRLLVDDQADAMFNSFMYKAGALQDALKSGRLKRFMRRDGTMTDVHHAVIHAAAESPVTKDGKFDMRFYDRVTIIYNEIESGQRGSNE